MRLICVCMALLAVAGCGAVVESEKEPGRSEKPTVLEHVTGKAAVDQGRRTADEVRRINAETEAKQPDFDNF